jgi:CHAD domain-containing protein
MPVSPDPRRLAQACAEDLLHKLELQLGHALKSQDAHQIHDLRVATRRFSQALRVFKACLGNTRPIRARCDSVMKLSGKVRDLDIAMKILHEEHGTNAADVLAGIEQQRVRRAKKLHALLARHGKPIVLPVSTREANPEKIHDALVKAGHRLFKRATELSQSDDPHPMRIAAKRLRYTLELAGASDTVLKKLADLQSELGAVHDMQTVRDTLARHGGAKKLLPKLERKQRRLKRKAVRIWKRDFGGKKNRELWMQRVERSSKSLWRAK